MWVRVCVWGGVGGGGGRGGGGVIFLYFITYINTYQHSPYYH